MTTFEPSMAKHVLSAPQYQYRIVERLPVQGKIALYYEASERDAYEKELTLALSEGVVISYGAIRRAR